MIKIDGVLDGLTERIANGWVNLIGELPAENATPSVTILVKGELIAQGYANKSQRNLNPRQFTFSLALKYDKNIYGTFVSEDIQIIASYQGVSAPLMIYKPIQLALEFSKLSLNQQSGFIKQIGATNSSDLNPAILAVKARAKQPTKKLCVITYANNSNAWFPYFYKYYSSLVGGGLNLCGNPSTKSFWIIFIGRDS